MGRGMRCCPRMIAPREFERLLREVEKGFYRCDKRLQRSSGCDGECIPLDRPGVLKEMLHWLIRVDPGEKRRRKRVEVPESEFL